MIRSILLACLLLLAAQELLAQHTSQQNFGRYGIYDPDRLPPSFHKGRRDALRAQMSDHSVAIFVAAPEARRSNDVDYLYHQDPDFYYLTGCIEPNAVLIIGKDSLGTIDGNPFYDMLFVTKRNPDQETWTGRKMGIEGAKEVLGFEVVLLRDSLQTSLKFLLPNRKTIYYNPKYQSVFDPVADTIVFSSDVVERRLANTYSFPEFLSPRSILAGLREFKSDEELKLLRRAIDISVMAHKEIMKSVRPGWHEYEIQALGEYIFAKNGAEYTGYPSIVGSGENSVILHYESNRRQTKPGDFVEMDMGAEYHGYSADVTRSYPVSGRFTKEQTAIYDLVQEAQDSGIAAARADSAFRAPHRMALKVIIRGLLGLGIIKDSLDYRKYFMHGTSHYLGLDVHDAGDGAPLKPGEVITVEPGIYIKEGSPCDKKWWNIGVRIEDDILITNNGPVNLSEGAPRRRKDVEAWMAQSGIRSVRGQ